MILNLTQHPATPEQLAAGVVDLPPAERARLIGLLTVDALPTPTQVGDRCYEISVIASNLAEPPDEAMIGGAPWMMSALESALMDCDIEPIYAFSVRESVEQVQPDGSVRKINVFRHAGFVRVES